MTMTLLDTQSFKGHHTVFHNYTDCLTHPNLAASTDELYRPPAVKGTTLLKPTRATTRHLFQFSSFYFISLFLASLRLEIILQEERIQRLEERVKQLTKLNRKCDKGRSRERGFLQTLIQTCKRDNVALSEEECSTYCRH